MYSKLPNLVLAFHGCDRETHDLVLYEGVDLKPSTNDYDWLGSGVYFWEQNYDRALMWAREQFDLGASEEPAVLGAVIDLGHCLNLTDSHFINLVEREYGLLADDCKKAGAEIPKNVGRTKDYLLRRLDCAVIEHLHMRIDKGVVLPKVSGAQEMLEPFDSARGLFSEEEPIYPGAGFKKKTHVQICVRNPNCIKGYFEPRFAVEGWSVP